MAAAPLPHHSNHDNDTCRFVHDDPLAATPRIDSPCPQSRSRSSSPSRLRHSLVIDEQLIHSEHPHSQALSIKRNPTDKSGESREKLELSTTSKARDYFSQILLTRNIHPVITVQNSGSVARDHLASERTFLAYVRTSLGLAGAGVALVQLFTMSSLTSKSTGVPLPAATQRLQKFAAPLGLAAIGLALVVLFTGEFLLDFL